MAFSIYTTAGDGDTDTFPINFTLGYLKQSDVTCRVGNEVDGLGEPVYRALEWITPGLVKILGAIPALDVPIIFRRTVNKSQLIHDYQNGDPLTEKNLDESNLQLLMAVHEFLDGRLTAPFANNIDMGNNRLVNMADGIDPQDAVNLRQLMSFTGDAPGWAAQAAASAAAALVSENNSLTYANNSGLQALLAQSWAIGSIGTRPEGSAKYWAEQAMAVPVGAVKISNVDTTAGFLQGKLVAGANVSLTKGNPAGNETLSVAVTTGTSGNVIGKLNTSNRYSAAQVGDILSVTYASSVTLDFSLSNNFTIDLTGSITLNNPSNKVSGQSGVIRLKQDATGGRSLISGSDFVVNGTINPVANSVTAFAYFVNSDGKIALVSVGAS